MAGEGADRDPLRLEAFRPDGPHPPGPLPWPVADPARDPGPAVLAGLTPSVVAGLTPAVFAGLTPGAIGEVVRLHGTYYSAHWGFGPNFEADVATGLGRFMREMDPERDLFLAAWRGSTLLGSVTLDATITGPQGAAGDAALGPSARLRWFIVAEAAHGTGVGRLLLRRALEFADARHYRLVWLTTFAGLDAARDLYERHGFNLVAETGEDTWTASGQGSVGQQRFERRSDDAGPRAPDRPPSR